MAFKLEYWNAPRGHERHNPFLSQFPDMPSEVFATSAEARAAAHAFVAKYANKGGDSAGGYNPEMDLFWIREEVGHDQWRFTQFGVVRANPGPRAIQGGRAMRYWIYGALIIAASFAFAVWVGS